MYDEKIIVEPTDDPIIPEDDTGGDNETNNNNDSNVNNNSDSVDKDINNGKTISNASVIKNNNGTGEITCEIVDNGKPVDKDKNNTKPIALPETGNGFALLISAILIIFVVCLAYWRK